MERHEEERNEMETQALSSTASRISEAYPEGDEEQPVALAVPSSADSYSSLLDSLLRSTLPSAITHSSLLVELLRRSVASPLSSRDAFIKALGYDLVRSALPTPTSSQDLRPGVVRFRPTGRGEGDRPLTPDCDYLRRHLGEPLVAVLAEVAAKRPRDPIHYMGHWLYRWRADSELREAKKKKIQELHLERERVAAERRAREEEERRAQVLEIAGDMLEEAFDRSVCAEEIPAVVDEHEGESEEEEEEDLPFT